MTFPCNKGLREFEREEGFWEFDLLMGVGFFTQEKESIWLKKVYNRLKKLPKYSHTYWDFLTCQIWLQNDITGCGKLLRVTEVAP